MKKMERKIKIEALKNPAVSASALANMVEFTSGVYVSSRTVRIILNSQGLYGRVPRKNLILVKPIAKKDFLLQENTLTSPSVLWKMCCSLMRVSLICLDLRDERPISLGEMRNWKSKILGLLWNMGWQCNGLELPIMELEMLYLLKGF